MLNITTDKETKNINKSAELKSADGTVIGTVSYNTSNQEYAGINFNLNIANKELFISDKETYKEDITSFLDTFIAKTNEIMGMGGEE